MASNVSFRYLIGWVKGGGGGIVPEPSRTTEPPKYLYNIIVI